MSRSGEIVPWTNPVIEIICQVLINRRLVTLDGGAQAVLRRHIGCGRAHWARCITAPLGIRDGFT